MNIRKLGSALLAGLVCFALFASPVKVHAASDDTSWLDLSVIDSLTEEQIANAIFPGASILVKVGDNIVYNKSFGYSYLYDMGTRLSNPISATNDTIYDLASVTKVTATTQAIMILSYRGLLDIDAPVANYWPAFAQNGKDQITARDLLTHTSGLAQWEPTFLYGDTRAEEKTYIEDMDLLFTPGTYKYSDFSFMSLAFLAEAITNQPIEEFLEDNLYGPLGMTDTMYTPLTHGVNTDRIAATSWGNPYEWRMSNQEDYNVGYDTTEHIDAFKAFTGWREFTLHGHVNDGNAGMANEGIAGHAGLFSTTKDLSILGDLMLNGGTLNGVTIYDQATIDAFTTADPTRSNRGLGWQIGGAAENSGYVGKYATSSVFSHAGFTGTQYILDGDNDLQVIILTNKQNLGILDQTKGNYTSPYAYSRNVMNVVYEALAARSDVVTSVQAHIDGFPSLDLSNHDATTVANYTAAVDAAKLLNLSTISQAELNATLKALDDAKAQLKTLDFIALNDAITRFEGLDTKDLDPANYAEVKAWVATLKSSLATLTTQSAIDTATSELIAKIDVLSKGTLPATGLSNSNTLLFGVTLVGAGLLMILKRKQSA